MEPSSFGRSYVLSETPIQSLSDMFLKKWQSFGRHETLAKENRNLHTYIPKLYAHAWTIESRKFKSQLLNKAPKDTPSELSQSMVNNKKFFQGWRSTATVLTAHKARAMSNISMLGIENLIFTALYKTPDCPNFFQNIHDKYTKLKEADDIQNWAHHFF